MSLLLVQPKSSVSKKSCGLTNHMSERKIVCAHGGRKPAPAPKESMAAPKHKKSKQTPARELTDRQIQRIRRRLLRWGRQNYQLYPWRSDTDGWLTFVAEVFLQRTRARQVEKVYQQFRKHYPTPLALLQADAREVSKLIEGLGLAFRAPILQKIALNIADRDYELPETIDERTNLKGVGMYTAAAWLSLHRGKWAVLIDSNVARWLSRMTGNPFNRDPRHVSWIKKLAHQLTPPRGFRGYNYSVLDFTMLVCTPRSPKCNKCPIEADCLYGRSSLAKSGDINSGQDNKIKKIK